MSIYYCIFPIKYLQEIHEHGSDYRLKRTRQRGVTLHKTRPYYLSVTADRLAIFQLFTRLLHYLRVGAGKYRFLGCDGKHLVDLYVSQSSIRHSCVARSSDNFS
jgi:hypothetical protein